MATLIQHPAGGYLFLPGIAPYSCGVVASAGYEIVHAALRQAVPYQAGFEVIARHLAQVGRPRAALCAVELRSPRPFSFAGFSQFNGEYARILEEWGLFVEGVNPVARTNVAPVVHPPAEPALHGFSYTRPATHHSRTFVVAGAGELPEGLLSADAIIAAGDVSPAGLETKARFVMQLMERRLTGLGADWSQVTAVDVYTVHPLHDLLPRTILEQMGPAAPQEVRWHYTRPPITGIEFEMDLRGVECEVRLA
ncbi:MAG: RidA family protein [Planctomycetales bacterium]